MMVLLPSKYDDAAAAALFSSLSIMPARACPTVSSSVIDFTIMLSGGG